MPPRKVFFFERQKMLENFQKIIQDDPPMGKRTAFYAFLIQHAGKQTNERHVILILTMAKGLVGSYPVNLSKHVKAIIDDAETVKKAKQMLENVAIIVAKK